LEVLPNGGLRDLKELAGHVQYVTHANLASRMNWLTIVQVLPAAQLSARKENENAGNRPTFP
jgi:hypothetical protein